MDVFFWKLPVYESVECGPFPIGKGLKKTKMFFLQRWWPLRRRD